MQSSVKGGELFKNKEFNKVILELKSFLKEDTEVTSANIEDFYILGCSYLETGDLLNAQKNLGKIIEVNYLYKDAKNKLENIIQILKENKKKNNRYVLLEEIGRGGMGIVYKTEDKELKRIVAFKLINPVLIKDVNSLKRFINEAKIAASLNHLNIIKIFDIGDYEDKKFISMEYVEGESLRDLLKKEKKINLKKLIPLAEQICEGLNYAHKSKIFHRDIKPDNILLNKEEKIKITDFGIAKSVNLSSLTITGNVVGTLTYLSPEQILGEEVDEKSDIYSLGITLYECLTGKPPFYEGDVAYQHLHKEPEKINEVSEKINEIILKAVKKNKNERYNSTEELKNELMRI